LAGTTYIDWKEVNVRSNYGEASKKIGVLKKGDRVVLTGKTYEYLEANNSSWVEIEFNGQTAWIVRSAIENKG